MESGYDVISALVHGPGTLVMRCLMRFVLLVRVISLRVPERIPPGGGDILRELRKAGCHSYWKVITPSPPVTPEGGFPLHRVPSGLSASGGPQLL